MIEKIGSSSLGKSCRTFFVLVGGVALFVCSFFPHNCYFRYMAGQKEYEVELQFTSNLLGHPNRTKIEEEFVDGEEPVYGSRSDLQSACSSRKDSKASSALE